MDERVFSITRSHCGQGVVLHEEKYLSDWKEQGYIGCETDDRHGLHAYEEKKFIWLRSTLTTSSSLPLINRHRTILPHSSNPQRGSTEEGTQKEGRTRAGQIWDVKVGMLTIRPFNLLSHLSIPHLKQVSFSGLNSDYLEWTDLGNGKFFQQQMFNSSE